MPSSLLARLLGSRSFLPPDSDAAPPAPMRAFRALCLVCAALLPAFWLAYRHAIPDAFDPLPVRLALAAALLAVFGWTHRSAWSARRLHAFGIALPVTFFAWWTWLAYANAFAPEYALGTLFVYVVGGLALSVVTDGSVALVAYSATAFAGTAVAAALTPNPAVDAYVLLGCLAGAGAVIGLVHAARVHAMAELRAAQEEAEAMARLKSAFLANMSHEIRTPLTGILGFAGVLAEEVAGEHREFVGLIERSGRRLLDTLNSVLDLARLEADGVRLEAGPVDVAEEGRQVVRLLRPLAEEKGVELRFAGAAGAVAALDATCLHRVLTNLVGNAIKFTEAGHVEVRVERVRVGEARVGEVRVGRGGGLVRVEVEDTGIGIDPAFVPHLFDEFKQESTGQARSHEGSGLGLAITERLVRLMGGEIAVRSEKGAGSTFTVTFPIDTRAALGGDGQAGGDGAAQVPEMAFRPSDRPGQDGGEEEARWEDVVASLVEESESPPAPPADRALLVAASPEGHTLHALLKGHYRVEAVTDARAALEALARTAFDVLILEADLGGRRTGADVLRVARTIPGCERLAAVALVTNAARGARLHDGGFAAVLRTPFSQKRLLDTLEKARAATAAP